MTPPIPALVLASASPRRRELLALLGLPFTVDPDDGEEILPATTADPQALTLRLARQKALAVAGRHPRALVLGADTVVVLGERVLGKPADAAEAGEMLRRLSGRRHCVVTGVALVDTRQAPTVVTEAAWVTEVCVRALAEAEIAAYVATGEPLDKAGAYAIQGRGAVLIEGIRGDYSNVVGLPVGATADLLQAAGVEILGRSG